MQKAIQGIVLAAGKATRFNTGKSKLLETMCGQELILYPLALLNDLNIPTHVVIGHQKDLLQQTIKQRFPQINCTVQEPQLGTGHALLSSREYWYQSDILLLYGDMPLLTPCIIRDLYKTHKETNAAITFATSHYDLAGNYAYERIVKNADGKTWVKQAHECSEQELQESCCVNVGIYLISRDYLSQVADILQPEHEQDETHIIQLINHANSIGQKISTIAVPFDRVRGINTFQELWAAEQVKRAELIKQWMENGVRFQVPQSVLIDLDVQIGVGTTIGCGVHLLKGTIIGKQVTVDAFSILDQATIGDHVTINPYSYVRHSTIESHAQVGPFAHVRNNSIIGSHANIGNFVEVKKSTIGAWTNAKHLSYLGDAQIGEQVNIGAGTITCNYDGEKKHQTIIEDLAFIGSNNSLVAPVCVGKGAMTAAGSTITENVPADSLAIARSKQTNKEGYMNRKKGCSFQGAYKTFNQDVME